MKLLAQHQSRAINPGRLDMIQRGINRLARSTELRVALLSMYQEQSRTHGRVDLGGKWNDTDILDVADWTAAMVAKEGGDAMAQMLTRLQTFSDLTILDGVSRTKPIDLVSGHPHQVRQLIGDDTIDESKNLRLCVGTLERMLKSLDVNHRLDAAVIVLEMHSVLARANEPSRELFNQFCARHDLDHDAPDFDQQLAALTDVADLSATRLRAEMRS